MAMTVKELLAKPSTLWYRDKEGKDRTRPILHAVDVSSDSSRSGGSLFLSFTRHPGSGIIVYIGWYASNWGTGVWSLSAISFMLLSKLGRNGKPDVPVTVLRESVRRFGIEAVELKQLIFEHVEDVPV